MGRAAFLGRARGAARLASANATELRSSRIGFNYQPLERRVLGGIESAPGSTIDVWMQNTSKHLFEEGVPEMEMARSSAYAAE
jgi:hypothetical protein